MKMQYYSFSWIGIYSSDYILYHVMCFGYAFASVL
jgi:hypothetical protein